MYAIHSVFIIKENILFLEEWIDYHIQLGFNKFYLYDNSKVNKGGGIYMSQKRFDSRFNNIGKPVTSINLIEPSQLPLNHSNKCIYKINKTECMCIHSWRGHGKTVRDELNNIWFNHYKLNNSKYDIIDEPINEKIKNIISENYKNYIKII
jgi:hypothetical protein